MRTDRSGMRPRFHWGVGPWATVMRCRWPASHGGIWLVAAVEDPGQARGVDNGEAAEQEAEEARDEPGDQPAERVNHEEHGGFLPLSVADWLCRQPGMCPRQSGGTGVR
jgi:hypothetical protein